MPYSAESIANAFIELAAKEGKQLSNMKLQKLLYFAQGHSLSLRGEPLITDEAQAWDYGPVYPEVYHAFKHFGAGSIEKPLAHPFFDPEDGEDSDPWAAPRDPADHAFLQAVWNEYSGKSAVQLSEMSHVTDGPWEQARKASPGARHVVIPKERIAAYFKGLRKKGA